MSGIGVNIRLIRHQRIVVYLLLVAAGLFIPPCIHGGIIGNVPVGPIDFIPLEHKPRTMITAPLTEHDRQNIIITYHLPIMSIFNDGRYRDVYLEYIPAMIEPVHGKDEPALIACVPLNKNEVQVLRYDLDEATFRKTWSGILDDSPSLLRTADVTNNGYDDILVLLHNRTGIGLIRNNGDGAFEDIEFLFDDILVSLFQVVDISGDGINDFILYDPIQNVLQFHYGFGDMIFSLERVQKLPASISFFHALPIIEDTIYDLVTVYPDNNEFSVFFGDGFGRYRHKQTQNFSSGTHSFLFTDLFANQRPDAAITEHKTGILRLYRNNSHRGFEPAGAIQLSSGIRDVIYKKDARSGSTQLCVLDVAGNRLIIMGLLPAAGDFLPSKLALASEASDMVAANLFGGDRPELYVLCTDPPMISVYWYDRSLKLNHSMISLPGNPDRFSVSRGPENRIKLVVSDKKTDFITIVSLQWERFESNMYGIPVMKSSEVIYLGVTPDVRFTIGALSYTPDDDMPTLSLFEQIAGDEYIEHTITPIQEEKIIALDVTDITGNNAVDIVYMFRRKDEHPVYVTSVLNDSGYEFRRQGNTLSLEDSTATRGFIISENTPDNYLSSFIVYLDEDGKKNGRIFRITADRSGLLSLSGVDSNGVIIRSPNEIVLLHSRSSPYSDLVYFNGLTKHIEIMRGNEDGSFMPPAPLQRVDDLTTFTVYSETANEVHSLVIGRKNTSYVEVLRIDE